MVIPNLSLTWLLIFLTTRPHIKSHVLCHLLPNLLSHTKINSAVLLIEAATSPPTFLEDWQGHIVEGQVMRNIVVGTFGEYNLLNISPWRQINRRLGSFSFFLFFFFFGLFRVALVAYGRFPCWGRIGAVATDIHQSHNIVGSEPCLQPTPQLMATQDPWPTERGQGLNLHPHGCYSDLFPLSHNGNTWTVVLLKIWGTQKSGGNTELYRKEMM